MSKPGVRGKKPGSGDALSPDNKQNIAQTICDKRPEQLKMDFALCDRPTVRQHIDLSLGERRLLLVEFLGALIKNT